MAARKREQSFPSSLAPLYDRRTVLGAAAFGLLAASPASALARALRPRLVARTPSRESEALVGVFESLAPSREDSVQVAEGHVVDLVLAWGDPLFDGLPAFDLERLDAESQSRSFGFNCDYNGFFPLHPGARDAGLLCVNHEYTSGTEMFRDYDRSAPTRAQFDIERAAHGMSIVEIARDDQGRWRARVGARRNRRITGTTPMLLAGPAAGSPLMRTAADSDGRLVLGTLNNCAGGKTPWGTVLTCEENFHYYFGRGDEARDELRESYARYGVGGRQLYHWEQHDERYDLARHPHEPHRFGWVAEVDPFDPTAVPVKHTALGRFKHEAASTVLASSGRPVVYMGDDERFEYVYKFVATERYDPEDRARAMRLLERGTLFVARFANDGTGEWLPLVPTGPLADWTPDRIAIHTRLAADLLGATPMDRPEDIEVDPLSGRVYVACTNNSLRVEGDGGPNPRAHNRAGHVLELNEASGDAAATRFAWSVLLACGEAEPGREDTALACPDNFVFDGRGRLWIATDGQDSVLGTNDSIYAVPTGGPERGVASRFLNGPIGCELCGPEFDADRRNLFVGVQHPGAGGGLAEPESTWPHDATGIPRPAVVAARRTDGAALG